MQYERSKHNAILNFQTINTEGPFELSDKNRERPCQTIRRTTLTEVIQILKVRPTLHVAPFTENNHNLEQSLVYTFIWYFSDEKSIQEKWGSRWNSQKEPYRTKMFHNVLISTKKSTTSHTLYGVHWSKINAGKVKVNMTFSSPASRGAKKPNTGETSKGEKSERTEQ